MKVKGFALFAVSLLFSHSLFLMAETEPETNKGKPAAKKQIEKRSPLAPVKTESPRDTMKTFMYSMDAYIKAKKAKSPLAASHIGDAVRTLNLSDVPAINRDEVSRESAILLKEVLDRVIVIDYGKIPSEGSDFVSQTPRWRLKDTEIIISRVDEGDRAGEWLFSPATVARTREFFEKVRHLPYLEGTTGGADYRDPWQEEAIPLPQWMRNAFLGLIVWQWFGILLAIFLGFAMRSLFSALGTVFLKLTAKTPTIWDEKLVKALIAPSALLSATGMWMLGAKLLGIRGSALTVINIFLQLLLSFSLIWIFYRAVGVLSDYIKHRSQRSDSSLDDQIVKLISSSLKTFIVVFGVLLAAQNLGVEIFSLLAGLGIGGLAVALAAKDTLANFFGSIMIMIDKPFQVGHWVIIGNIEGTVEEIGFRTTRIRTFYNSLISVPNSNIATSGVDNLGLRTYRRVKTNIDITYGTRPDRIESFVEGIKEIIRNNPYTRKDYFHVVFNDFAESSLRIMLYFFFAVPDWSMELVERQKVLLDIIRLAESLEIQFAFPTRTLHIENALPLK